MVNPLRVARGVPHESRMLPPILGTGFGVDECAVCEKHIRNSRSNVRHGVSLSFEQVRQSPARPFWGQLTDEFPSELSDVMLRVAIS
jgi:hypothetical protein